MAIYMATDAPLSMINEELSKVEIMDVGSCLGVPYGLLEYDEYEYEPILIVEDRSVATFQYKGTLDVIIDLVNERISNNDFNPLFFDVNATDGMSIDLAKQFNIYIQYVKAPTEAEYNPERTVFNSSTNNADKVFIELYINPYQYSDELILQYLYHEINHCSKDLEQRKHGAKDLHAVSQAIKAAVDYQKAYRDIQTNKDKIAYLVYNLFVDTEFNALMAQCYGDFERRLTDRRNFSKEVMSTSFYRRYDGLKHIVEILEKQQGWEEHAMSYFNQNMNVNSFRTWFLDMAKQRIKELWRRHRRQGNPNTGTGSHL